MARKTIIDNRRNPISLNLSELLDYRDLLVILSWRDFRVRYAQTFLGLLWALIQPLVTLLIFSLIFGRAINVDTGTTPYPVYALTGLSVWSYFAYVLSQSGQSLVGAQDMIKKIYFPRLIIPLSKAFTGLVDFGIALIFFVGLSIVYGVPISGNFIYVLPFFGLCVLAALGVGIWVSALTIRYRDFQHVVPFMVQVGLYATPIAYPSSIIPEKYQLIYHLNPMAGVVEGFRWSLIGGESPGEYVLLSVLLILVIFLTGVAYFNKVERTIADII